MERLFIEGLIRSPNPHVSLEEITYLSDGLKVKGLMAEPVTKGNYEGIIYLRGGMQQSVWFVLHDCTVRFARICCLRSLLSWKPWMRGAR